MPKTPQTINAGASGADAAAEGVRPSNAETLNSGSPSPVQSQKPIAPVGSSASQLHWAQGIRPLFAAKAALPLPPSDSVAPALPASRVPLEAAGGQRIRLADEFVALALPSAELSLPPIPGVDAEDLQALDASLGGGGPKSRVANWIRGQLADAHPSSHEELSYCVERLRVLAHDHQPAKNVGSDRIAHLGLVPCSNSPLALAAFR